GGTRSTALPAVQRGTLRGSIRARSDGRSSAAPHGSDRRALGARVEVPVVSAGRAELDRVSAEPGDGEDEDDVLVVAPADLLDAVAAASFGAQEVALDRRLADPLVAAQRAARAGATRQSRAAWLRVHRRPSASRAP